MRPGIWSTSYGTSNQNVRNRIESGAVKTSGTGTCWSKGRINACKAVGLSCTDRSDDFP